MYNEIYKVWKAEKSTTIPQPLPSDFYNNAAAYLKTLADERSVADATTLHGHLILMEQETIKRLLDELKQTRLRKIALGAQGLIPIQAGDLTRTEVEVITTVKGSFTSISKDEQIQKAVENNAASPLVIVRFIQDIPEIVGVDLKTYGPFKKEDVASVPLLNGQALEKQGAVKVIEVKGLTNSPEINTTHIAR